MSVNKEWSVYILKCSDDTYYTGITNDFPKRLDTHNNGKGAKYTRGRLPVIMEAVWIVGTKSEALKEEYRIKKLSRIEKKNIINSNRKKLQ